MGRHFLFCITCIAAVAVAAESPKTGPLAEKRFPPLRLPDGFRATLFASDPLIEYPSVISLGPKVGSLYVAIDYMTGLGTDIVRRDEIRHVEDTDGDGYADKASVFADGFNSIQGIAYHDGTVYVMHAPYLTALRDTKKTGKADERRDLLKGLGLAPEVDQIRLHNANGVVVGHDGWLYLALGDRGCDVKRPEGDRLVLNGGGILRCRPDGRDLHVFSTGLRNIYDVALDEDLNVLTRDNENDGGDYKIRVCHSFYGADHGYPYLYHERPKEALAPLADLGLGSSAGTVIYLEKQFPAEYRGNLFSCEWGRSVVRYPLKRSGASFTPQKETDFAAGAPTDPYGFKPTDVVVDRDGSLFVSDWGDGQRPKRGRGRIYRIRHGDTKTDKLPGLPEKLEQLVARLDSDSSHERCAAQFAIEQRGKAGLEAVLSALASKRLRLRGRLHAIWIVTKLDDEKTIERVMTLAQSDPETRVQAQAIRALADLTDPVLVRHRLDAGRGDDKLVERIAGLAKDRSPQVLLEVIVALGRLRWNETPNWLGKNLSKPDDTIAHAAQWAIRQSDNWPSVLTILDERTDAVRDIFLRAAAEQYQPLLVDGLIARLKKETGPGRQREYGELLARVYKKPATPWVYWGFRPQPRPANVTSWDQTAAIEHALNRLLLDAEGSVKLPLLRQMLREKVPAQTATLGVWLKNDRTPESVSTILAALADRPGNEAIAHLDAVVRDRRHATANRLLAISLYLQRIEGATEEKLPELATALEDGPVLGELLRAIGKKPKLHTASALLLRKTTSSSAEVRAGAVEALAGLGIRDAEEPIRKLLGDDDPRVRSAAALAAGKLRVRTSTEQLLRLVRDANAEVRRSSLEALRQLQEKRVVPVAVVALDDPETSLKALECVGELGGLEQLVAVVELARRHPSAEVLAGVGKALTGWATRKEVTIKDREKLQTALAEIHGASGILLAWHGNAVASDAAKPVVEPLVRGETIPDRWHTFLSVGIDARVRLAVAPHSKADWIGVTEIVVAEAARVEFFAAGSTPATVWLNGKQVYQRDKPAVGTYPDRFEASLVKGRNRVVIRLADDRAAPEFALRFRHRTATPERERLALAALSRAGNPERGRQVFLNAEKSLCIKCHKIGDQGERIGPELTGLGSRFSKIHIVESVLEPSRTISPSFESIGIDLKSGKILNGVKIAETDTTITIADNEGRKHIIARADIEQQRKQPISTMPEGLEKRISEDEFVDLISFLVNLKETTRR